MGFLILIRHGESRWNIANKFTGMVDVPLSEVGIHEALIAAKKLEGIQLDVAFTSQLIRAQQTLMAVLSHQDACGIIMPDKKGKAASWSHYHQSMKGYEIPVYKSFELNERYYGDLQGMDKDEARKEFGKEQVFIWRRSYDIRPPGGESLKDVVKRSVKYYEEVIKSHVVKGENVIVAAHGNSLRAIIKHLDGISDEAIPQLELTLGQPIIYEYKNGILTKKEHTHSFKRPIHWQHTHPLRKD